LHLAVKEVHVPSKRLEIVNLLLQYGANPNVVDRGPYKQTPLDIAAFDARDADVVRSLLAAGAKLRHYSVSEDRRLMTEPVQKAFENAGLS
jgi:ankyrin repeat protein